MEGFSKFFKPFYAVHLACVCSYIPVRLALMKNHSLLLEPYIDKEYTMCIMAGIALLFKFKQSTTWEGFIHKLLWYLKAMVLGSLWYVDRRIMTWYIILFAAAHILFPTPKYTGKENTISLTPIDFKWTAINATKANGGRLLAYFYADWCSACVDYDSQFAELSMEFGSPDLKFAKVDASHFPELAKQYDIDTSATTKQLPTLLMFEDGKLVSRLPAFKNGKVVSCVLDKKGVVKFFDLGKGRAA